MHQMFGHNAYNSQIFALIIDASDCQIVKTIAWTKQILKLACNYFLFKPLIPMMFWIKLAYDLFIEWCIPWCSKLTVLIEHWNSHTFQLKCLLIPTHSVSLGSSLGLFGRGALILGRIWLVYLQTHLCLFIVHCKSLAVFDLTLMKKCSSFQALIISLGFDFTGLYKKTVSCFHWSDTAVTSGHQPLKCRLSWEADEWAIGSARRRWRNSISWPLQRCAGERWI